MAEIYIPTLHTFAMENKFSGSAGNLRFVITPNVAKKSKKEVDFDQSTLEAEYWYGPFCYEKSEIAGKNTFPLSEEGRLSLKSWLESLAQNP